MHLLFLTSLIYAQDPFIISSFVPDTIMASRGVAWADYDNDGYPDFYVANGTMGFKQANFLYHNNGDGTFTRVVSGPAAEDLYVSNGCSWGDFDNDGDLDLYVATTVASYDDPVINNCLYENNGDGTFTKNSSAGPAVDDREYSCAAGWGDYNNDGFVDLFIKNGLYPKQPNSLYSNNGNGTFTDITGIPLVSEDNATLVSRFAWGDYDNDGDLDIAIAVTDGLNSAVWRNDGSNVFTKLLNGSGGSIIEGAYASAPCWGDYDNDGDLDLFMSNYGKSAPQPNFLYRYDGNDTFTKITDGPLVNDEIASLGCAWGDIDNDGDLDMFVGNDLGTKNILYMNNGDGTFERDTTSVVSDYSFTYGSAFADYNKDGFIDLFIAREAENILFENNEPNNGNTNHWIDIQCAGMTSNKAGIGAKVRVRTTVNSQVVWQMREICAQNGYSGHDDLRAHFGLGDARIIEELKVDWPSGISQTYSGVTVDQFLSITESDINESIQVTAPNGGEMWQIETAHNITWTSSNTSGNVDIDYSTDDGATWNSIASHEPDAGLYAWTVPDQLSTNCFVRVMDSDGIPADINDAVFSIVKPSYVLTVAIEPAGSGTTEPASGDHTYFEGTVVTIIALPDEGYNFVNWTGDVADPNNDTTTVTIDGNKSVTANFVQQTRTLTMVSNPTEGGTTDPASGDHVYPYGEIVTIIAIPANGYQLENWTGEVTDPNNDTTTVTLNGDKTVTANFTAIPPSLVVTTPNGSEDWAVGSTHNIMWTSANTSGTVKLEYSVDNGTGWIEIIAETADDGVYEWTIPDNPSTTCLVKISDPGSSLVDESDAVFTISNALFDISGKVNYGETGHFVSDAIIDLTHDLCANKDTTNSNGDYLFTCLQAGNAMLLPSKLEDWREAISGSDALLVLQYLAFLAELNDDQQFAGDVTEDGSVSGSDAQAILRYLAFYSDNIGMTGQWRFLPADTSFVLDDNAAANFNGYLKGDANLNWGESSGMAKTSATKISLTFSEMMFSNDNEIKLPIEIDTKGESFNTLVATISYDPGCLKYKATESPMLSRGFMLVVNGSEPGKVHLAMAGATGMNGEEDLLVLIFEKVGQPETTDLQVSRLFINDQPVAQPTNAHLEFYQTSLVAIPDQFNLEQNYPNPFNPETQITYHLPEASDVVLKVFNLLGDEICTLVNAKKEAGIHYMTWNGKDANGREVSSGVYLLKIQAGNFQMNRKMVKLQ
jgi:hypothetical protein